MRVVELRQYALRPGQRDVLIELFDREFVESQEAAGARVIGQFRDLDRPDRFVWLRGFADLDTRLRALTDFYGGPAWKAHAAAANATMLDVDDVLLLRPAGVEFALDGSRAGGSPALIAITVFPLASAGDEIGFLEFLRGAVEVVGQPGRRLLAELRTEPAENNFPALPVRAGEHVVVTVVAFDSPQVHAAYQRRLRASPQWQERVRPELTARLAGEPQRLRLRPTARSLVR